MFCTVCGSLLENGDLFCSKCGARITPQDQTQPACMQPLRHPEGISLTYEPQYILRDLAINREHAKKLGIAKSAMIMGIVSCGVPAFFALIFSSRSKKKLKKLKDYKAAELDTFVTVAKITSNIGFIFGLISTVILGVIFYLPIMLILLCILYVIAVFITFAIAAVGRV